MTQDLPTAADLVGTVADFLEDDVLAELDGRVKFHTRVSVNILRIVARELTEGAAMDAAEHRGLVVLLGHEGELEDLNRELAAAIRDGSLDEDMDEVVSHTRRTVADKLRVANPEYA